MRITEVHNNSGLKEFKRRIASRVPAVYVGIPAASSAKRRASIRSLLGDAVKIPKGQVNNAELLFIFSKGSPARSQPARPVLKPSVEFPANREIITREAGKMMRAHLEGDGALEETQALRTAEAAQNAARGWFTNSANRWAPNAESTIREKKSDKPGIDTGSMRSSIVGFHD